MSKQLSTETITTESGECIPRYIIETKTDIGGSAKWTIFENSVYQIGKTTNKTKTNLMQGYTAIPNHRWAAMWARRAWRRKDKMKRTVVL